MRHWKTVLRVSRTSALLLVTSESGDLLKARLPLPPKHPRALLTLLEGLALWDGAGLRVVVSVSGSSTDWLGSGLFGDELFPGESQLVQFDVELTRFAACLLGRWSSAARNQPVAIEAAVDRELDLYVATFQSIMRDGADDSGLDAVVDGIAAKPGLNHGSALILLTCKLIGVPAAVASVDAELLKVPFDLEVKVWLQAMQTSSLADLRCLLMKRQGHCRQMVTPGLYEYTIGVMAPALDTDLRAIFGPGPQLTDSQLHDLALVVANNALQLVPAARQVWDCVTPAEIGRRSERTPIEIAARAVAVEFDRQRVLELIRSAWRAQDADRSRKRHRSGRDDDTDSVAKYVRMSSSDS